MSDTAPNDHLRHWIEDTFDVWNLRDDNKTGLTFDGNLPGANGPRGYQVVPDHHVIVANTTRPLHGVFTVGGPRAALASQRPSRFPYHIFGPADDIHHVGMSGMETARPVTGLEPGREVTTEAIVAERFLEWQTARNGPMPLFFARTETAPAPTAADLAQGMAVDNFGVALANWTSAAQTLGKQTHLDGVILDYCIEDTSRHANAVHSGIIALMDAVSKQTETALNVTPRFFMIYEAGTQHITSGAAIKGQMRLFYDHGLHDLTFAAPGYMFELDENARFTDTGREDRGTMLAHAMAARQSDHPWSCPTAMLAAQFGSSVRVTFEANSDLVLDPSDPFGAGVGCGFGATQTDNRPKVVSVEIAADDPKSVIVHFDQAPTGAAWELTYAYDAAPRNTGPYPANCGSLRDTWHSPYAGEDHLRRWALPTSLKVSGP